MSLLDPHDIGRSANRRESCVVSTLDISDDSRGPIRSIPPKNGDVAGVEEKPLLWRPNGAAVALPKGPCVSEFDGSADATCAVHLGNSGVAGRRGDGRCGCFKGVRLISLRRGCKR